LSALIDTSVLVADKAEAGLSEPWSISVVSLGELEAGVLLARDAAVRAARLHRLTTIVAEAPVLAVDQTVAARYGELRAATGRLPSNDLWIAATALAHDRVLVTRDERQAALPLVRTRLLDDHAAPDRTARSRQGSGHRDRS
jgi:predicted nucleic acid-binding protein